MIFCLNLMAHELHLSLRLIIKQVKSNGYRNFC